MSKADLAYERIAPATEQADSLIFLIHGVGADGNDLIPLGRQWQRELPGAVFEAPHAPQKSDMTARGRQWFSLADPDPHTLQAGVEGASPRLRRFIQNRAQSNGLPLSRVAVVGFSQGAVMALYIAPRLPEPVAGVVSYAGMLGATHRLDKEMQSRPPILLVHGEADEIVEHSASVKAEEVLEKHGFQVEFLSRPGVGHAIDEQGLQAGGGFLRRVLGA